MVQRQLIKVSPHQPSGFLYLSAYCGFDVSNTFQTSWYRDNNTLGKLWNDPKTPVWNRFHPVFIYWNEGCCLKGILFYF